MRQSEGEIFNCFLKNSPRHGVALFQRRSKVFGFSPDCVANELPQKALFTQFPELPDSRVHRPAGTALLENSAALIQTHMADLSFSWRSAVVNLSVHHQSAANPAAKRDIEHRIVTDARPDNCFA